jgi:hypothetical protein
MFSEPDEDPRILFAKRCQLLGVGLYLVTLILPIAVTSRQIDEFGNTAYGYECAVAALISMLNISAMHFSGVLAGWVTPLVLCSLLIDRDPKLSRLTSLQPYLAALAVSGLIASRVALSQAEYRPLYGYYLWVASALMISLPGLLHWKHYLRQRRSA